MWLMTPDTDLLKELPQEYTFETALADLIDNSLQAVWSNDRRHDRHISVVADEEMISIFDNGPGMDASDGISLVKWGEKCASHHRSYKEQAIGGKPPYLKPFFGMFGYGGPVACMQLGRRALVSSKTKDAKKVYTLKLDREAFLSGSWKTIGSMRDAEEDEMIRTPHGSFTKINIFEPNSRVDIDHLRCKLRDIYLPYIQPQYDEDSSPGKTIMPLKFEVNGVDLTEIDGGEITITNMHSCNGPDFVLQLQFSSKQDNMSKCKSPDSKTYYRANARVKCAYFPIKQGKENIDKILEKLGTGENFETFNRVSIRWLGRLLPDARWGLLPFMDLKQNRETSAQLLKSSKRVKCFIETDAGFDPTSSKTDLARHSPYTTALRNIGNNPLEKERDVEVQMYKDGNLINPSQLKKEYEDWIIAMHHKYDHDEADCGEDQPVFLVSPANKQALGISSDVARVYKSLRRNGRTWKRGERIEILKGACPGVQSNSVYATIEYFLLQGLQDESGGEARILCRPSSLPDENGCILSVNGGDAQLDVGESLSVPLSVIDAKEECEKGTTIGVVPYNNGLLGYVDTRTTKTNRETKEERVVDGEAQKTHVISQTSNMYFLHSGHVRECKELAETLQNYVKSIEDASGNVSLEVVADFAYKHLEQYLKSHPKNTYLIAGIIISMQPSKEYDAYGVGLQSTELQVKHLKSRPYLMLGSGSKYAKEMLNLLNLKPSLSKRAVAPKVRKGFLYATFCDYHTGGTYHEFDFQNGHDFNMDTMHEEVDPLALHLTYHRFSSMNLLIMAIKEPSPVRGTKFEEHLLETCLDVACASRLIEKGGYSFYRVYCKVSAEAAYTSIMKTMQRASERDRVLPDSFLRVWYSMDGKGFLLNVSRYSKELLAQIQSS